MCKFWGFIFSIALCVFTHTAQAKVCFLPGVLSDDGCLTNEEDVNRCAGYTRTTPCLSGCDQSTCVTRNTTYYKCVCRNDNIKDIGGDYICLHPFDPNCGCSTTDAVCNTNRYPFNGCEKYPGTVPSVEKCESPKDGKIWYKSCTCPAGVYPYDCKTTGLKKPGMASTCESPDGEVKYSFCLCDSNWSTTPCTNRSDGCTNMVDHVYNGLDTCYYCGEETCPISTQINLENYWCNISQSTKTDCATLGYSYRPGGTCPDGSIGLKCPFDGAYMYCTSSGSSDSSCQYASKSACETTNAAFICSLNGAGCYIPYACATGYVEAVNRQQRSHTYTAFTANGLTCYKPDGCLVGYQMTIGENCIEFNSAGFKCYACAENTDVCPLGTPMSIEDCGTSDIKLGWSLHININGCNICRANSCAPEYTEDNCPDPTAVSPGVGDTVSYSICYSGDVKKCAKVYSQIILNPNDPCCSAGFRCRCNGVCSNDCSQTCEGCPQATVPTE